MPLVSVSHETECYRCLPGTTRPPGTSSGISCRCFLRPKRIRVWFEPLGDTSSELFLAGETAVWFSGGKLVDLLSDDPTAPIDPDDYSVETREGTEYFISRESGPKVRIPETL